MDQDNEPTEAAAIAARAYELWEEEGYPEGREHEHWLRAEHEIKGRALNGAGSPDEKTVPEKTAAEKTAPEKISPQKTSPEKTSAEREPLIVPETKIDMIPVSTSRL